MLKAADLCVDCSQPHSGKNNAKRCRLCYLNRRRKLPNICPGCGDPITRNAARCRRCSYPRHGTKRPQVPVQDAPPVRPQLPETVQDTLLSGRPWMRLARRSDSQFVVIQQSVLCRPVYDDTVKGT